MTLPRVGLIVPIVRASWEYRRPSALSEHLLFRGYGLDEDEL